MLKFYVYICVVPPFFVTRIKMIDGIDVGFIGPTLVPFFVRATTLLVEPAESPREQPMVQDWHPRPCPCRINNMSTCQRCEFIFIGLC